MINSSFFIYVRVTCITLYSHPH